MPLAVHGFDLCTHTAVSILRHSDLPTHTHTHTLSLSLSLSLYFVISFLFLFFSIPNTLSERIFVNRHTHTLLFIFLYLHFFLPFSIKHTHTFFSDFK